MKFVYKKSDAQPRQNAHHANVAPQPATLPPVDELDMILEEYRAKAELARAAAIEAREKADALKAAQVRQALQVPQVEPALPEQLDAAGNGTEAVEIPGGISRDTALARHMTPVFEDVEAVPAAAPVTAFAPLLDDMDADPAWPGDVMKDGQRAASAGAANFVPRDVAGPRLPAAEKPPEPTPEAAADEIDAVAEELAAGPDTGPVAEPATEAWPETGAVAEPVGPPQAAGGPSPEVLGILEEVAFEARMATGKVAPPAGDTLWGAAPPTVEMLRIFEEVNAEARAKSGERAAGIGGPAQGTSALSPEILSILAEADAGAHAALPKAVEAVESAQPAGSAALDEGTALEATLEEAPEEAPPEELPGEETFAAVAALPDESAGLWEYPAETAAGTPALEVGGQVNKALAAGAQLPGEESTAAGMEMPADQGTTLEEAPEGLPDEAVAQPEEPAPGEEAPTVRGESIAQAEPASNEPAGAEAVGVPNEPAAVAQAVSPPKQDGAENGLPPESTALDVSTAGADVPGEMAPEAPAEAAEAPGGAPGPAGGVGAGPEEAPDVSGEHAPAPAGSADGTDSDAAPVAPQAAPVPHVKFGSALWREHRIRAVLRDFPKAAAALSTAALLMLCLFSGLAGQNYLIVTDTNGMRQEYLTTNDTEAEALDFAASLAGPYDVLTYRHLAPRRAEVKIARAFPVALRADGQTHFIKTTSGSVGDLLARCGVELSGEDFVEPAADAPLESGTYAAVHRVTYEEEKSRTEVDEQDVAKYKKAYEAQNPGEEFKESNAGLYDAELRHRLVDGVVESTEVLSLTRVIVPRPANSYAFTPGIPQSRIVGYDDIEMDEDGFPVNYTRVWQGAVCTAYSSSGGRGSSGLGLYCGTAAVNPNVIPYGTRMFITDASGYYVYGFCIATDTGTAMMEGYVDIDLYFEDNAECYAFGKRGMNVYFFD